MLKRMRLKNFTVFKEASFEFAYGLNVIVGENGTGKTHVLKSAYAMSFVAYSGNKSWRERIPTEGELATAFQEKLFGVFRPDDIVRLVRFQAESRRGRVDAEFGPKPLEFSFELIAAPNPTSTCSASSSHWQQHRPIFVPTRETLSLGVGFVSAYDTVHLPFDETWHDICLSLGAPLLRRPPKALLGPLEELMGGAVVAENGRFYLDTAAGRVEAHLLAEGVRKVAMLAQLIANGSLVKGTTLYWDEPEANLNSKMTKLLARTILQLCRSGVQVFVATHSLFLIRELDILLRGGEFDGLPRCFVGAHPGPDGVEVEQGDSIEDMGPLASLEAELEQNDRYLHAELP